jgi:hypothetical protein
VYASGVYPGVTAADNPDGLIYDAHIPHKLKQYAAFGEVSEQFLPTLKLTLGARYYKYDSSVDATQAGIFTQSVSAVPTVVNVSTSAKGFNPKVNLSYTPTDDLTVYGTAAKGFRPGGVNLPLPEAGPNSCLPAFAAIGLNQPTQTYSADSVWSYEVGEARASVSIAARISLAKDCTDAVSPWWTCSSMSSAAAITRGLTSLICRRASCRPRRCQNEFLRSVQNQASAMSRQVVSTGSSTFSQASIRGSSQRKK